TSVFVRPKTFRRTRFPPLWPRETAATQWLLAWSKYIESSPWPRRDRGSAVSKTIPFGSYREGIGLLPATKLAPTWGVWWAQQGSNLWPALVRRNSIVA